MLRPSRYQNCSAVIRRGMVREALLVYVDTMSLLWLSTVTATSDSTKISGRQSFGPGPKIAWAFIPNLPSVFLSPAIQEEEDGEDEDGNGGDCPDDALPVVRTVDQYADTAAGPAANIIPSNIGSHRAWLRDSLMKTNVPPTRKTMSRKTGRIRSRFTHPTLLLDSHFSPPSPRPLHWQFSCTTRPLSVVPPPPLGERCGGASPGQRLGFQIA